MKIYFWLCRGFLGLPAQLGRDACKIAPGFRLSQGFSPRRAETFDAKRRCSQFYRWNGQYFELVPKPLMPKGVVHSHRPEPQLPRIPGAETFDAKRRCSLVALQVRLDPFFVPKPLMPKGVVHLKDLKLAEKKLRAETFDAKRRCSQVSEEIPY